MPPRIVAQQLSHPTGLFGRLMGRLMNRHNARMNAFALELLELTPADRVLEIGFGGGATLSTLIERAGFVAGIDRSQVMAERAKARYAGDMAAGRAEFREGTIEALPFEAASFDKVCTVNTIYFWRSLEVGFAEIHRVLTLGGRAVIGFLPKSHMDRMGMPRDIFTARATEDVVAALENEGFVNLRVERPQPKTPWNVIVARC
jgi:SAM-dependent methyltransferase